MAEAATTTPPRPSAVPRPAPADPFANKGLRAAEVQYQLPLGRLPAGPYLLTFEATMGKVTLRRDVQFSVR